MTTGYRSSYCLSAYAYMGAPTRHTNASLGSFTLQKDVAFDTQSFPEWVISGSCVIILMYPHRIPLSDIYSSCFTESVDHPCLGIIHVACGCKALENMHAIAQILKVKYRFSKKWYIFLKFHTIRNYTRHFNFCRCCGWLWRKLFSVFILWSSE